MSFLQPWLLLALPLVTLPVVIHLINQRRFQSVPWAAMMFLHAAKALSRGYTRLRQWLILLLRMLALAAVIVAVSRPLTRGWLALVGGGGLDTVVVVLDRSPSMVQASAAGGESKLATAKRQVAEALGSLGPRRLVLIESGQGRARELASASELLQLPESEPAAAPADWPALMQAACDALAAQGAGTSELWLCTDQRAADWRVHDGAWSAIRQTLGKAARTVRVTLLAYPDTAADNLSVRVRSAQLVPEAGRWQLLVDLTVQRAADGAPMRVPVQIELGEARSTVEVELTGAQAQLNGHAIAVDDAALVRTDDGQAAGWGRVTIPQDTNPADNAYYFTFGTPALRRTVVVAEDASTRRTLSLMAGIAPDRLMKAEAVVRDAAGFAGTVLDDVALVLWQAALPEGDAAAALEAFIDRGGQVVLMPPTWPGEATFAGVRWGEWTEHAAAVSPQAWRGDEGLLAATGTGQALPVGELSIRRVCDVAGEVTALASLADERVLLGRVVRPRGGVYVLATTPSEADSDLARNGVVLYAVVQRAVDAGLVAIGRAVQAQAGADVLGATAASRQAWRQVAGDAGVSTEAGLHPGVYESGGRLVAINRAAVEDAPSVAGDAQVDELFSGLTYTRFQQQAGGVSRLVQEVWRLFLVAMLLTLIAEGLLSMPRRSRATGGHG